jgi:hypothetical protein
MYNQLLYVRVRAGLSLHQQSAVGIKEAYWSYEHEILDVALRPMGFGFVFWATPTVDSASLQ